MTLEQHIKELLSTPHKNRAFSTTYNGQKIWVKLPAMGESNIWHTILSIIFKITKNPILAPTVVTNPKESLSYEVKKLKQLNNLGINVPEILLENENYIVLSDCGTPLSTLLNKQNLTLEEKKQILTQLSTTLATMHNLNLYHSRPALRDITYFENKIYLLDFEENLDLVLNTKEAVIRDALIYIHSLYRKLDNEELIKHALDIYFAKIEKHIYENIKNEVSKYKFLVWFLGKTYKFLGKDAKAIFKTLVFPN